MAATAKLGYPEAKHGIVAAIVMANLVRKVGRKAAFELVAPGEPIDAARALALGMVNRVTPPEELLPDALALGGEIRRASSAPPWRRPSACSIAVARPAVRGGARARPRHQQAHARVRKNWRGR